MQYEKKTGNACTGKCDGNVITDRMRADSATVATVAGDEIPAGLANFYARMTQAQYESMYSSYLGDNMWTTEASEGKTYEKLVKDGVALKDLENMYLLEDHMDDYKISLSDDEKKAIKDAAKEFSKDNDKDDKEKVSGDTEYVERYLTLATIKQKMTDAIEAEADTNVTDDEAKQKSMQYVLFSINTTDANGVYQSLSDEEKANVKANAEAFAEGAKIQVILKALHRDRDIRYRKQALTERDLHPYQRHLRRQQMHWMKAA